jgi:WD40 repeat protein/serine/threonine protein kinase
MTSPAPEPSPEEKAGAASARAGEPPASSGELARERLKLPFPSVPDHELLRCIGRGAYGSVWLARNVMGTWRAVKVVHREDFNRDRPFTREYEGLLKFEPISRSHPNLMQILHVGRRDGHFYYVTELADDANAEGGARCLEPAGSVECAGIQSEDGGAKREAGGAATVPPANPQSAICNPQSYGPRTLQEDLARRGRLPAREWLRVAVALASALKHLHDHHLVHRDVKPSNVIFVNGVPKLADIGLVATVDDSQSIVGTEGYLPPEGPGSVPADLFSLGKMLYEICTGNNRSEFPRLPQDLRDLPDARQLLEFNEVLLKACARDTDRRYHSADELLADLVLLERGDSVKRLRRLERHQQLLRRVGVGLLAVTLVISAAWWQSWRAHRIANRHLAQLHLNQGTQRMLDGDYAAALPWLVGALQLDAGSAARERAHRLRIAGVLGRCPLPVAHYSVPESRVLDADLNADCTRLATAHDDGWVRLWDTRSGEPIGRLTHDHAVLHCQFLPSGDRLLTVSVGQKAQVWDWAKPEVTGRTFTQAMPVGGPVYSVGLNKPLGIVYLSKASYCFARTNALTNAIENLTLGLKLVGQGDILSVSYEVRRTGPGGAVLYRGELNDSPGAEPFVGGRDFPREPLWGQVYLDLENLSFGLPPEDSGRVVWDHVRMRRYRSGEPPVPWQVVDDFSSDTLTNWVGAFRPEEERTSRTEHGQLVLSTVHLPAHQTPAGGSFAYRKPLEISRADTLEVEADLVEAQAQHPVVGLTLLHPVFTALTAPDRPFIAHGRWLATTWWDGPVRIWDLERARSALFRDEGSDAALELGLEGLVLDIDFSPDTNFVALATRSDNLSVWNFRTGLEVAATTTNLTGVTGARFSPDNRFLAVSHNDGVELMLTADWHTAHRLGTGAAFSWPRFSPTGSRMAAVRESRDVVVWDLGDLAEPMATFHHPLGIVRIAFSPDGRYLAASTANGVVQLWDVIRSEPCGPPLPGALARFSANGTELLLFDNEGGVWVWDLSRIIDDTLTLPPLFADEPSAASKRGTMTAVIKGQGITLETADRRYSLECPARAMFRRVVFSPDDNYLIAESSDRRAWIWDTGTRTLAGPPRPVSYDAALTHCPHPDLPMENRDRRTLSDLAALLGRQRPDGAGGMMPVVGAERARLFNAFTRAHPVESSEIEQRLEQWNQMQAEEAERAMTWDAAVLHWEEAMKGKPGVSNPNSELSCATRLAYARQAHEVVQEAMGEGRSRWSVNLPRPSWATPEMLDLGRFHTLPLGALLGSGRPRPPFRELASGVQVLGGTGFDVRGIICITRTNPVTIPAGRACQRIHFLHATGRPPPLYGVREDFGTYQVTYADGATAAVTLRNPEEASPYSAHAFYQVSPLVRMNEASGLDSKTVWAGSAPDTAGRREPVFLTRTTWVLPAEHRGKIVETLRLQALPADAALLIFAITVE